MKELPVHTFFEGFYIWFNQEKKEEYYSTPLYKYSTKETNTNEYKRNFIELEKDISKIKPSKKEIAKKYPALIYAPFVETIGMLLVRRLNADFSSFEMAYNTFFMLMDMN